MARKKFAVSARTPAGPPPAPSLDREKDLQLWSAKKWLAVTPPMRPSPFELSFYEKALRQASLPEGTAALILGATPELRSLALKLCLRTTGCDLDENFWHAMTLLRTVEGNEEFLPVDWLDLPENRRFDVVLGDCAINMLTCGEIRAFVEKVHKILTDDGISIQRMLAANESLSLDDIGKAVASYRMNNPGISLNLYLIYLVQSLRSLLYPDLTYREFFESHVFSCLTAQEIKDIRPFLTDKKLCFPRPKELTALIDQFFIITHVEKSSGPGVWDTAQVYVLKKKRG